MQRENDTWIDVPITSDDPVRVALFRHFLTDRSFPLRESDKCISIRTEDADKIHTAIKPWAFEHDMPEDPRQHDSLANTMQAIGTVVTDAIESHRAPAAPVAGIKKIDLR